LKQFVLSDIAKEMRVLEVNQAFMLTQFFKEMPNHVLAVYPQVDMMDLPFEENQFDLVVHSDTLEHVEHPVRGLSECFRVLKPGGFCAFTIPMIVDRLTMSRQGLPFSYHGSPDNPPDNIVHTEYGADAWKHVVQAGFEECRIFSMDFPTAQAMVGRKNINPAMRG
jgi:ubiquinone/menaquinone biosynthesis C-methylase UbiE